MEIPEKLLQPYNPKETEQRLYKLWEESGFFNPDVCIEKGITRNDAKSFTIVMPPPNVTGVLHMGHAMMLTLEDIMIRYKRMKGFKTLWIPGTDHAAIATQSKVEKEILKKEGLSRHDLGREELLKRVRQFAKESHDTIASQIRVMGSSCDWSREAFTLDDKRTKAVYTMFKKMYEDGLIYRDWRVVNWDPKGQTTISDDEIVHESRKAKLYTFKYNKDFPISIATSRPETKFGDTAIAVHPNGKYKEFIGKEFFDVEFCGFDIPKIKIIGDESVDPEFGTGALGVTPAHSMSDYDLKLKHGLDLVSVINERAQMTVHSDKIDILGKKTTLARDTIVEHLRNNGLLEKEEDIDQNVGTAERTGGIIEPLPKLQWFISVNKEVPGRGKTLKDIMREPIENEKIKIIPEYFDKTYFHWIDNLRDWCISRQIWYGHRVPVWYKGKEIFCGFEKPEDDDWTQDEDTLDTWFSSALWTFSTLGWPEETKDLEVFHPTDVLETGYEILFFWVARMIMMAGYALDIIPFNSIYLHGTVRDGQGRKMSKSLGNGIDPLDIADKFGSDAGRMALVVGTAPGTDSKISEDKIKGYKNFCNKLWNITRFILSNTYTDSTKPEIKDLDLKIIEEFDLITKDVTDDLDNFRFHLASEKLYQYAWHRFADVIIEESKTIFASGSETDKKSKSYTLFYIHRCLIKLLHPFMPFVTEEIWSMLPYKDSDLLMVSKWPEVSAK